MERGTVKLGQEVRDRITGYRGIVNAVTEWLNGCMRVTVQARELREGKPIESQTFDVEQIELVGDGLLAPAAIELLGPNEIPNRKTGGPC